MVSSIRNPDIGRDIATPVCPKCYRGLGGAQHGAGQPAAFFACERCASESFRVGAGTLMLVVVGLTFAAWLFVQSL